MARTRQATTLEVAEEMRGQGVVYSHVVRLQRLGGLLSFYQRRAAA